MQPVDGFALLALLRTHARYSRCKVVAVTASVMNQEISQLRRSGFDGAIGKPLDFDHFASLIEKVLHGEEVWYVT
jgi:DNA-binding NarL/FixJ family response regulator